MSKTKTISERDIAAAVRKYLEAQGLTVRSEVPVTLPDHGQVFLDLVWMKADPEGDTYGVVECKTRASRELLDQATRLKGLANRIEVAYRQPKVHSEFVRIIVNRMDWLGIGRILVSETAVSPVGIVHLNENADTRLISQAFHSHDGSLDAPAGVAAAKRMTADRCQWESLRKYVSAVDPFGNGFFWKDIQHDVPEMRRFTAAAARRAIDKGECVGVGYRGNSITAFFAQEKP